MLIFKEQVGLYKSIENVRGEIRTIEGNRGDLSRRGTKNKDFHKKIDHNTLNEKYVNHTTAKMLVLDIETAPLLANIWGIWNQNINLEAIHSDWFMLTWSAKWLFDKKIYSDRVTPKEAIENNDKRIVKSLIDLLNQADIVITHNGDKFDLPRINTRAIINNLTPPLSYLSIDTLKVAKRSFAFTSNKLDYINKQLGLEVKTKTDITLWRDCFHGKEEGLKRMEKYNINDVKIHEQTYLRMRPYIKSHPNLSLFVIDGDEACPSCGSKEIKDTGKSYVTGSNTYETFRCESCNSIGRRRKANKKGKTTNSIAR
jgi:DNA polymerase elongation subunit (family B)